MAPLVVFGAGQKVAQIDGLALGVGQFDADGVAALDHGNPTGAGGHRPGDIVGQSDHAAVLHARRGHQFIECHDRAGADLVDHAAHAELLQHAFQHLGVLLQRFLVDRGGALTGFAQYAQRRQVEITLGPSEVEGLLVHIVLPGLGRLDRGDARLDRACGRGAGHGLDGVVFPRRQVVIGGLRRLFGIGRGQRRLFRWSGAGRSGLGGRLFAGGLGLWLRRRGCAQRLAPVQGVQEIHGAQADGEADQPQPGDQEDEARDYAAAGDMQGAETARRQACHRIAPQTAQTRRQRPGGGRGQGGERAGQQKHPAGRGKGLQRRGLEPLLDRIADRARQAEGEQQQGGGPGRETQRLHEQVGEQGAVGPQPVGRRQAGGRIQTGVRRIPRHQGDQQQGRQQGLKHAPEPHHEGRVPQDAGADPGLTADDEGSGHEGSNLPAADVRPPLSHPQG